MRINLSDLMDRGPVLSDGAMGTQLFAAGLASGACPEVWNVDRADTVAAIHQRYRDAGSRLITTNTFGGTSLALARHGHADRVTAFNEAGARLAHDVTGDNALVLGDIGPFGGFLEPLGDTAREAAFDAFREQAAALRSGGADVALVETMTDPDEMAVAVEAALDAADWPVIATYAFDRAGERQYRTMMGAGVEQAMDAAVGAGANVVGANCGTSLSLDDYAWLAEQIVAAAAKHGVPVVVQANAGSPSMVDGNLVHPATADDMAALVPRLIDLGVAIIGGCCGTTPDHLRAMARSIGAACGGERL